MSTSVGNPKYKAEFQNDTYWVEKPEDIPGTAKLIAEEWTKSGFDITAQRVQGCINDMCSGDKCEGYVWYGKVLNHYSIGYVSITNGYMGWRGVQHLTIFTPETNFYAQGVGMGSYHPGLEELRETASGWDDVEAAQYDLCRKWMLREAKLAFNL